MPTQINYFDAMLKIAKQHIKNKNFDQASVIILQLEKNYKKRWELFYEKIRLEKKKTKNYSKALEQFQSLSQSYPDVGIIYFQMSKCHWSLNQMEQAVDLYEIAIQQDQRLKSKKYNPNQYQQLQANNMEIQQNDEQKLKVALLTSCQYEKYLQIEKNLRFLAYIPLHQYEKALTNLSQLIDELEQQQQQGKMGILQIYKSLCYFKLKKYEQALEYIDKALNFDRSHNLLSFQSLIQIFANKQCLSAVVSKEEISNIFQYSLTQQQSHVLFGSSVFSLEMNCMLQNMLLHIFYMIKVDDAQAFLSKCPPTAYSVQLHFFNLKFKKKNNELKQKMIDNVIQNTAPFALGYQVKFNLLVELNKRDEALLIFDQVERCNDSYEKFITMANILILKEQFEKALMFIQKAQQIDRYDEESYHLRAQICAKTDQFEQLSRDLDYIKSVGKCDGYFGKIVHYAWQYLYKFQYFKALKLCKHDHDCLGMNFLEKSFEIMKNFYLNKQTNFEMIKEENQYSQFFNDQQFKTYNVIKNMLTLQANTMVKDELAQSYFQNECFIFLDLKQFYYREFACNSMKNCNQKEYTENQLKINIVNRYCESLIDLFNLIFTNIEIQPNQLPFGDYKSINQQIIELTYHIYQKMCYRNKTKFMRDLIIGLNILISKFKKSEWEQQMKQELNKIREDILQRIESQEYDFFKYASYLGGIYEDPYFFDGISKIALSDCIKFLGYTTLFSDMLDIQQDLSEIIQDHFAYRKLEKVYEIAINL